MTVWFTARGADVLAALRRAGWTSERQKGSHKVLAREGWPIFVFSFSDHEEIGPRMLARIAKKTGLDLHHFKR